MSDERALKLLEAFSGVEETLLERCERAVVCEDADLRESAGKADKQGEVVSLAEKLRKNFRKSSWRYGSMAAAALCVVIVGLASLSGLRVGMNDSAAYEAVMEDSMGGAGVPANEATTAGAMPEASSTATMYYTTEDSAEADRGIEAEGSDVNSGAESETLKSANDINADTDNEEKSAPIENEEDALAVKQESAVVGDSSSDGCKEFAYATVTEEEARAHEVFGAYVPAKIPEGYVLEGAYISGEKEAESLMVSWSRGMDSVMVNITLPEEAPATVEIQKTETYDEHLYEIPHAETVPADYREVFNNPVCAWEDFSLEFVQKRMIVREDAGDTDTPRGNFSVLYPDGVLVYFNGRGTAEEIWELFASMDANR